MHIVREKGITSDKKEDNETYLQNKKQIVRKLKNVQINSEHRLVNPIESNLLLNGLVRKIQNNE